MFYDLRGFAGAIGLASVRQWSQFPARRPAWRPGPPLGYLKFVQRRLYKPGKLAICNFLWSICMEKIPPGVPVKCGVFSGVWRGRHETCSTNWSSQMAQTVSYLDYFDHQRPESQEWWRQVGVRGVGGWWVSMESQD